MKKKKIIAIIAASVVAIYLVCVNAWNMSLKASFSPETNDVITYNGRVYRYRFISDYEVYRDYKREQKTYICIGNISKYYCFSPRYFVPLVSNTIDKTESFIVVDPDDSSLNMTYVAEDFVFPEPSEDNVDFIRATYTRSEIYDKETVSKFANAALSGEEIEIDDELLSKFHYYPNYGVGSWDFLFEYKDCPLYSRYCIIKTESGKYQVIKRSELC